jgi:hypothetical protein
MIKCRFYDDGIGNGGYCSGMNAGPPSCSLNGNEKCNGNTKNCNINQKRIIKLNEIINKIKKEI